MEKTNHMRLISNLVFQLNAPPFNAKLPGLYHLRYTWNSFDILPFEIEGTRSATDKTLVWQTRGREIKSQWRRGRECVLRKGSSWMKKQLEKEVALLKDGYKCA